VTREEVLGTAHAGIGFERKLPEQIQDFATAPPAEFIPGQITYYRRRHGRGTNT